MISSFKIAGQATYPNEGVSFDGLRTHNFFFGSNGVGKTTISRFLRAHEDEHFSNCTLEFEGGKAARIDVFNIDFVAEHFDTEASLQGIYTLGENVGVETELREKRQSLDEKERLRANDQGNLTDKREEIKNASEAIQQKLWSARGELSAVLKAQSKAKLFEKFEACGVFDGVVRAKEELIGEHETLSDNTAAARALLGEISFSELERCLNNPAWSTALVGSESSQISGLIEKIGHGDWVHQGHDHLEAAEGDCPFCQQPLRPGFETDLKAYFDESYREGVAALETLNADLNTAAAEMLAAFEGLAEQGRSFLDEDRHKALLERLRGLLADWKTRASEKLAAPSTVREFPGGGSIQSDIDAFIREANTKIANHNNLVENRTRRKKELETECWAWLAEQVQTTYEEFSRKRDGLNKAVETLSKNVEGKTAEIEELEQEIAGLERQQTSIEGAVSSINQQLTVYGFQGFKLEMDGEYRYRIVRDDGSRAKETLSEGERSFIAFLYFYYLVHGAHTESGAGDKRVVVIDDPVTSMDSNVMMIVVQLVRDLLREAGEGGKAIQQMFVMSHNAYFHGQVAARRAKDGVKGGRSFWVVRKTDGCTCVERNDQDPVKSSYDILWDVVRSPASDAVGVQNAMRRILEHYFTLYEGLDFEGIVDSLPEAMKAPARVLISFLHDGSHNIYDDYSVVPSAEQLQVYRNVFHRLFDAAGQEAHYKRQMGDAFSELEKNSGSVVAAEDMGVLIQEAP